MTRRMFARLWTIVAGAAALPAVTVGNLFASTPDQSPVTTATQDTHAAVPATADDKLQSEFLFDLVFEKGAANVVGSPGVNRVVVAVQDGTFEGPKLKGTLIGPSGDWITARPDKSSVLDMRFLLLTDDAQKIYMTCRGIAYTLPNGALYARIVPMFETGSEKYAWLNNVVAVGVYRPMAKIAYRVYQIL